MTGVTDVPDVHLVFHLTRLSVFERVRIYSPPLVLFFICGFNSTLTAEF